MGNALITEFTTEFESNRQLNYNKCLPQAQRTLLNNPRYDYSTIFTEPEANNC